MSNWLSYLDRIPDYRLFLPIRNETFDVFDSGMHPTETTVLQLRIVASHKSGLPLSAFRLITDKNTDLVDHIRLSQYDIGRQFIDLKEKSLLFHRHRLSFNIDNTNMDWLVRFFYIHNQRFSMKEFLVYSYIGFVVC